MRASNERKGEEDKRLMYLDEDLGGRHWDVGLRSHLVKPALQAKGVLSLKGTEHRSWLVQVGKERS